MPAPRALLMCVAITCGCCRGAPTASPPAVDAARQTPLTEANAAPEPAAPTAEPAPRPTRTPQSEERIEAARQHAQGRVLTSNTARLPSPGAPGDDALPGAAVALEQPPDGNALLNFYAALERLQASSNAAADAPPDDSEPRAPKLRIAVYGASGTAADMWTGYLRAYLQARFGDGGPGVVSPARPTRWFRHNELSVRSRGRWQAAYPQRKALSGDNRYGLMLQVMRGWGGPRVAHSRIAPGPDRDDSLQIARFELWSFTRPGGGTLMLHIDDERPQPIDTTADLPGMDYRAWDMEPGPHEISLWVRGPDEVRLAALIAESAEPGVVVDTLGFDGARLVSHSINDEASWSEQLQRRDYALYILAYGTNEGFHEREKSIDVPGFEAELQNLLSRLGRAAPGASCVMCLPSLHRQVRKGQRSPAPRIEAIRPVMRRLGHAHGCALFDGQQLIGDGGIGAWVKAGLARRDYVHLTPRGNVRYGMALTEALMRHWDRPAGEAE